MSVITKEFHKRVYQAPAADVRQVLEDVVLCTSGETEDWVYDGEEFGI